MVVQAVDHAAQEVRHGRTLVLAVLDEAFVLVSGESDRD
jgi:hypothetical protein